MQNYQQPGVVLPLVAPYNVASGAGALVGSLFGVATSTYLSGATGEFLIKGVATLVKNAAEAWTQGETLYWDNSAKNVTVTSSSNTKIGCAAAAAANPSSTGSVLLNGTV